MGRMILIPGADFSGSNLGQATVAEGLPIEGITINGPGAAYNSANYTAKLWPTFTSQRDYVWSIVSGGSYATIDSATGHLSVSVGADASPVTIRCTSVENPNIYTDKTVLCSVGTLVYHDYLESDGTTYIRIPRNTPLYDATITARIVLGSRGNGYAVSARDNRGAYSTYGVYLYSSATKSRVWLGPSTHTYDMTTSGAQTTRYKVVLHTSSDSTTPNATFECYDDATNTLLNSKEGEYCYILGSLVLFALPSSSSTEDDFAINTDTQGLGKVYGLKIEKDGVVLGDYRPATIDNVPCMIDYISGLAYYSATGSGLTAGDD